MILWETIYNKIRKKEEDAEIDIRYLSKWIRLYPQCFPKFFIKNNYHIIFNNIKLRYEVLKNG